MKKQLLTLGLATGLLLTAAVTVDAATDGWQQNGNNWSYIENGTVLTNSWKAVGDNWYYFDQSGTMKTGWYQHGDNWYLFTKDGQMRTGWHKAGDTWFMFTKDGQMRTGWYKDGDTWYYFKPGGYMTAGQWQDANWQWYYFNDDGSMMTQDVAKASDGKLYAIDENGYLLKKYGMNIFIAGKNVDKVYYVKHDFLVGSFIAQQNTWVLNLVSDYNHEEQMKTDLAFTYLTDQVAPNTDINLSNVLQNFENYPDKQYFGANGLEMKADLPEVTGLATIEVVDGHAVIQKQTRALDIVGYSFSIINHHLVMFDSRVNGKETLKTGYFALIGDCANKGQNLLVYANEKGEITHMKRLGIDYHEIVNKEMPGFFDDQLVIDNYFNVTTVK